MSGVDNRIVTMKFDNAAFERGAATTMSTLDKLEQKLGFSGASKGLEEVQRSADRFSLNGVEGAVTNVSKSFLALSTVAITALSDITRKAVDAGLSFAKSFTTAPIKQGFQEYGTTLNSIQTILANTGLEGKKGLAKVNSALNDLNHYSDKTIYNFSQMARNIGTFTAAGVDLKTSTAAIKGIANLAAVSGSNADQASTAMYQLSQALAAGSVKLMDWNSVVNAGMGGKVFQTALVQTAEAHGIAVKKIIKDEGSFRNSLQKGWLTSKVLTDTLDKFTGDLNAKQLKAQGYNAKQIQDIMKLGKVAQDAATKVKTLPQLVDTLQEAIGSGWSQTFTILFGNFTEAKTLFTGVSNVLGGLIQSSSNARNKVLGDWKKMGGRTILIQAISNAFHALMHIVSVVKDAFHDIFPPVTGKQLLAMTKALESFTKSLEFSGTTADNLKRTFRGVFAIFDIIGQVIGGVVHLFGTLFGVVGQGSGGFLSFTGSIGDMIVAFDQALKKGGAITKFFDGLAGVLRVPIQLIQALGGFLVDLFSGVDGHAADGLTKGIDGLTVALTPLQVLGNRIHNIFTGFLNLFRKLASAIQPVTNVLTTFFKDVGNALAASFSGNSFNGVLDAINTGLLAGMVLLFRKFVNGGLGGLLGKGKGSVFGSITGAFNQLTGTLKAMQTNIKADTLLKIAAAVGLLTLSVVALSLIDSAKLTKALSAMAVGFGELLGAMAVLVKISGSAGFIKVPAIAAAMVLMATSVLILTGAVAIMAQLSWNEIAKGLTGTAGALVIIAGAMRLMPNNLPITAAGLVLVGIGLAGIAGAMKIFGSFNWQEIGKGLVGMGGALVIIAGAMQLMPLTLPITAAGLILVGIGLAGVAGAMKLMAGLSWKDMAKGLVGIAGALVIIAGAMNLMPVTLPITAAGLVLVAVALTGIAAVAKIFATMSWQGMAKAGVAIAGALLIIAGGLALMEGSLLGSAALIVAAGALAILAPVMVALGALSWEAIAKGLVAIAGAFAVLGVAGLLLAPIVGPIIALAAALALTGAGLALAGAGALAFAAAFAIITATGAAGVAVISAMLNVIIDAIPAAMAAFGEGLKAFAQAVAQGGPQFVKAFVTLLDSVITAIIKVTPKIARLITVLIHTAIAVVDANAGALIAAGYRLIISLLKGLRDHIGDIVHVVSQIIQRFIQALGNELPKLTDAGVKFIIKFINGLATAIDKNSTALGEAGGRLGLSLVTGMVKGIAGSAHLVVGAAVDLGKKALGGLAHSIVSHSPSKETEKLGKFFDQGFAKGIVGNQDDVKSALKQMHDLIKASLDATTQEIEDQQKKIKDLKAEKNPNEEKIKKAKADLVLLEQLHKNGRVALKAYNKDLADSRQQVILLGREYGKLTDKLNAANDDLKSKKTELTDFATSTHDAFATLPDIDNSTTVNSYLKGITTQEAAVTKFHASLDTLRNMGLTDTEYRAFLDKGVGIQPFLNKLLAAGPQAVAAIDAATDGLSAASQSLGDTVSVELYQVGVDVAQALVNSLKSQRQGVADEMTAIGKAMVKAIRKALKSHSPSREMEDVSHDAILGITGGLDKYSRLVEASAANVGRVAIDSFKSSLAGITDTVPTAINVNPVVTPVLDLSQVSKDADAMNQMLNTAATAQASFGQAADISAQQQAAAKVAADTATTTDQPQVVLNYEQTNNSPKALDPSEIYVNTKSALALAKEALK